MEVGVDKLREKIARVLWSADQDSIETPYENLMCGPVLNDLYDLAGQILDIPEIRDALTAKTELDALKLALLQSQCPPANA